MRKYTIGCLVTVEVITDEAHVNDVEAWVQRVMELGERRMPLAGRMSTRVKLQYVYCGRELNDDGTEQASGSAGADVSGGPFVG